MTKRITNEFTKANNKFVEDGFSIEDLFLFSQMLRKELLSDILEIESLLLSKTMSTYDFGTLTYMDLLRFEKHHDKDGNINCLSCFKTFYENIDMGCIEKFKNILIKEYEQKQTIQKKQGKIINDIVKEMSFGDLNKLLKNLNQSKINGAVGFIFDANPKITPSKKFYTRSLNYFKALRNNLAHQDTNLDSKTFFHAVKKETMIKKKTISELNEMTSNVLKAFHNDSFFDRFIVKMENNPKIKFEHMKKIILAEKH